MSELEVIAVFLIGILQGVWLGWYLREKYALRIVNKFREEMFETIERKMVNIDVTKQGDQFFVHNSETGEFLAQGVSHEEIAKRLNERYPGTFFTATSDNLRSIGYKHDSL